MSHFLAGYFSGLWIVAIPYLVRLVKDGFRAGIRPDDDLSA